MALYQNMKTEIIKLNTSEAVETAKGVVSNIAESSRMVINSQPTLLKAQEKMSEIKEIKKMVLEKKESITRPLNEALKTTRELFKPIEEKISLIENYLKDGVLKYNQKLLAEQKKAEEEALKKMEEEMKKGNEIDLEKLSKPLERVEQKLEKIQTRKIKKLNIINEQLIPRAFLMPNEQMIKDALLRGLKVEGCEIMEEEIIINNY